MSMTNLLSSNKLLKVNGTMTITDETHNLTAEFTYGAVPQARANQDQKAGKLKRFKTMLSSKIWGSSSNKDEVTDATAAA